MKIALVTATFPPYMAGSGNVCFHNAIELAARGHEVTVFTDGEPTIPYPYPDSITVNRIKPLFRVGNAPFIPSLLKIRGFDIIHLHYPFFFGGEMIYFISRFFNLKYLITYHNDVIFSGCASNFFLNIFKKTIMRKIIDQASAICVSSIDFGVNCELSTVMSVPFYKLVELPIGIDTDIFDHSISGKNVKEKYHLVNEKIILFVAGLDKAHYYKGLEYLLTSFAQISSHNCVLMIVGEGNLKEYYYNLAKDLQIIEKTIFIGNIRNEDLPEYYAASTLFVLPSTIESFGLVLVEAMACGKPVIAPNLPGVRTVVDHEVNGLLFEPGDVNDLTGKIIYLLDNDNICNSLGREGRLKTKRKYSWKPIGKKIEKIYINIIENK